MRTPLVVLLTGLLFTACADMPSPEEQQWNAMLAMRAWIRGPMMQTCPTLPGPESRHACVQVLDRWLAGLRQERLTSADQYRVELAKAKGTDEIRHVWTRAEHEAWLHGPRTLACQQAPFPATVRRCLEGVQQDLDGLSLPDGQPIDAPELRAERAVARLEARERDRAIEQTRAHEQDVVRQQAAGQVLMGLALRGGLFPAPVEPVPTYQPPTPVVPLVTPTRVLPPVSCTSRALGSTVYTDCY